MDAASLMKKTIAELKSMLQEKGLKTNGKKNELVDRLIGHQKESGDAAGEPDPQEGVDASHAVADASEKKEEVPEVKMADEEHEEGEVEMDKNDLVELKRRQKFKQKPKFKAPASLATKGMGVVKGMNRGNFNGRRDSRDRRFNAPFRDNRPINNNVSDRRRNNNMRRDNRRPQLTPEERKKRRMDRLIKISGIDTKMEVDDEELIKRQKRLERFGGK